MLEEKISEIDLFLDEAEISSVTECIEARWLTEGPKTQAFATALTELTHSKYVTFAPNGTLALFLALLALDLPRGSEILIPSFTFYASATSAIFAGLKPVFVDVHLDTFNLDPGELEKKITSQTRAIMPVHCYGQSCDMEAIVKFAQKHDLRIVEDAAQACGVQYDKQQAGTFGDVGIISFFSDKVITTGEGAALLVQDKTLFDHIKLLRNQGRPTSGTFIHPELGMNFRITDLQAAIGCEQIKKFEKIKKHRLKLWEFYLMALQGIGDIQFMSITNKSNLVPFRFPFTTNHKSNLQEFLLTQEIKLRNFFYPLHLQPKLRTNPPECLPNSEKLNETGLCLPVHQHLTLKKAQYIVDKIKQFFESFA